MNLNEILKTRTRVWVISGVVLITLLSLFMNFDVVIRAIGRGIMLFMPLIIAFFIAFLSAPLHNWILNLIDRSNTQPRSLRIFSASITLLVLGVILAIFLILVIPQLTTSINTLINNLPQSYEKFNGFIEGLELEWDIQSEVSNYIDQITTYITENLTEIITMVYNFLVGLWGTIVDVIWGTILSIVFFMVLLVDRETLSNSARQLTHAVLANKKATQLIDFSREVSDIFRNYFLGQALDSLILGVALLIVMLLLDMPYALLIAVINLFTNMIPFFGPFLGAIPSILILLTVDFWLGVQFLIIIIIAQQIDGNIISPRILGNTLQLPSFMILFSITIFGSLFGLLGMIFGVPVMAVLYRLLKRWVDNRLEKT